MAATLQILEWRSSGLRCPDHHISCAPSGDQPAAVTLIQMPNGTGKTTTLTLLRLAMSGGWHTSPPAPAEVRKLQKKGSDRKDGIFEVVLLLNDKRLTIQMLFDFSAGRVRYKTTKQGGQVDGFQPLTEFKRFLNSNFINFFVFDGELANNLLDDGHTDAESVVEALFQLNTLQKMRNKVGEYWDRQVDPDAGDERKARKRENKAQRARDRLAFLLKDQSEKQRRHKEVSDALAEQKRAFEKELSKSKEAEARVVEAKTVVESTQRELRDKATEVLDLMRDPHALAAGFARDMYDLKVNLDRAKLPGTAAREFFQDLAGEKYCVCGTEITPTLSVAIKERASEYLGSDDVGFLNSMKSDIEDHVGATIDVRAKALNDDMLDLEAKARAEREAQNEFDELTFSIENGDPAIAKVREEIKRLEQELEALDDALDRFEEKDTGTAIDSTWGIDVMQKRITAAEKRLASTKHALTMRHKRDALNSILASAHQLARNGVMTEICTDANRRIRDLLPNNDIRIDRIDRCLVLDGQEGGSVGENLSVAYGFLATLFDRADHQLPFVVDSPAGPIDLEVRPKIGALVPRLSKQFIAFTISSERAQFVGPLKAASGQSIQFVTMFRKGPAALEAQARKNAGFQETGDGISVPGENFFDAFQLDSQEEVA